VRLVARSRGQVSPQGPAQLQGRQAQGQAKAEGRYKGCPEASAPAAERAIARGWLRLHESGTYVRLTEAGAELFA
jgi:hypothetical protein